MQKCRKIVFRHFSKLSCLRDYGIMSKDTTFDFTIVRVTGSVRSTSIVYRPGTVNENALSRSTNPLLTISGRNLLHAITSMMWFIAFGHRASRSQIRQSGDPLSTRRCDFSAEGVKE